MGELLTEMLPLSFIGVEAAKPWSAWNCRAIGDCGAVRYPASPILVKDTRIDVLVRLETLTASPPALGASR